jgi:Protein of unknown function (DUF3618)
VTQQIEAQLAQTRQSMAETVDVLEYRLRPASLAQDAGDRFLGLFRNADGSVRMGRTAAVGAVALVVLLYLARRKGA